MFTRLGRLAARHRWPIIIVWLALAASVTAFAPNIDDVAVNDTRAFLATRAPSLEAAKAVDTAFPGRIFPSTTVIVVDARPGNRADEGEAWAFLQILDAWLTGPEVPDVVERVVSPVSAEEQTARALVSADGQVALVIVAFNAGGTEDPTKAALVRIGEEVDAARQDLDVYMTGDASIIGAYDEATKNSMESTTWITILLVVLILLAVYRSPVSPTIPLLTISLAYLVSRGIVAVLGEGTIVVSGYTNIFLIVVLFGAGTDYCLFLISRFREEIVGRHSTPGEAVTETVRTVGETIASSAGTVVVGLSTMALAELGLFNTTGPSVAIGVVVALLAGLTFTPALLSLLGTRTFWPRRTHDADRHRFWNAWAGVVTGRPRTALLVTLAVLIPLALYGRGLTNDFDLLQDLPKDTSARLGFDVLAEHMGPGTMQPLTVVAQGEGGHLTAAGLTKLGDLSARIEALDGVSTVRGFTSSLAERGTLSVEKQLAEQLAGVREGRAALEAAIEPGAPSAGGIAGAGLDPQMLQQAQQGLLDLFSYLQQLGREIPRAAAHPGYGEAMAALSSIAQMAQSAPLDPEAIPGFLADLDRLAGGLDQLHTAFAQQDGLMLPATYLADNEGLRSLRDSYLSSDGGSARLQVVLNDGPYTPEALRTVDALRLLVDSEGPGFVEGASAVVADLRDGSNRDMVRAVVFVLLGVFVVLVLLLRALAAPLYLILTILVSYGATLGIVRLVFVGILGVAGVTWWVPIFMFVMLVALGMDYNIFLMGRVKEEVAKSGHQVGIRTAVARTGGIITSAGIIMAGTFAAMMSASILGLVQVGFAVAVGVLLDTFIVRTALVPSIAVILGDWSWWPRRAKRAPVPAAAPAAVLDPQENHP